MKCPQCTSKFQETEIKTKDNKITLVHECYTCGGHFFPSLIANFINTKTARNLDSITPHSKKSISPSHQYKCPICKETLTNIQDDSVPRHLSIFTCPENHGHFFPRGQLLAFKKAQRAKLEYHQIWGIPLKSAFAILLPVIAIFTLVGVIPLTVKEIQKRQESRIAAASPISNPIISPIEQNQYILSFTTKIPTKSSIKIDPPVNEEQTINISTDYKTTHILTLENLKPHTTYIYTITISDQNNIQTTSQKYTLTNP